MAIAIATVAKRVNPMLVVTFIAPEVVVVEGAEVLVRSGTGGPVAEAPTPAITGPVAGV
jgi:hypothetical protein